MGKVPTFETPQRWIPAATVGGRSKRAVVALAVVCCSPVLLPLLCVVFPFLCLAAVFLRLRRPRAPRQRKKERGGGGELVEKCEEKVEGRRLLDRYLEEQLGLVGEGWRWSWDDGDGGDGC